MHIAAAILYQKDGVTELADQLWHMDICIDGVAFSTLDYAERFKKFLEQKYIFKLLTHDYGPN